MFALIQQAYTSLLSTAISDLLARLLFVTAIGTEIEKSAGIFFNYTVIYTNDINHYLLKLHPRVWVDIHDVSP